MKMPIRHYKFVVVLLFLKQMVIYFLQMLKQKQNKIAASLRSQSADSNISQKSGFRVLPPISSKGGKAVPERSMKAYGQGTSKNAMHTAVSVCVCMYNVWIHVIQVWFRKFSPGYGSDLQR